MRALGKIERSRLAIGGLAFALFAPLAYLVQRLVDHARFGPPDPLAMLRQVEVAYYWRSATAAWWGGLATIIVVWLADPETARGARLAPRLPARLAAAAASCAVAFILLAWLLP